MAVVYVNDTNLNEKLVKEGYAEVIYIPPSEFYSRKWIPYTPKLAPTESFSILVFAIIAALIVSIVLPEKVNKNFGQNS